MMDLISPLFELTPSNIFLWICLLFMIGGFLIFNGFKVHQIYNFFILFGDGIIGLILFSWFLGSISFIAYSLIYGMNYVGNFWDVFKFLVYIGFGGFGYISAFKFTTFIKTKLIK